MSTGRPVLAGVLFGVGAAGFLDETVFHQLLHWHHFYDRSTPDAGLVSDGLLHAGSWICTVAGLFLYADLRRRGLRRTRPLWAGTLLGFGAFQVYDGLVQHKLLDLHQIRYGVELLPYDAAWLAVGTAAIVAGLLLLRPGRARTST